MLHGRRHYRKCAGSRSEESHHVRFAHGTLLSPMFTVNIRKRVLFTFSLSLTTWLCFAYRNHTNIKKLLVKTHNTYKLNHMKKRKTIVYRSDIALLLLHRVGEISRRPSDIGLDTPHP